MDSSGGIVSCKLQVRSRPRPEADAGFSHSTDNSSSVSLPLPANLTHEIWSSSEVSPSLDRRQWVRAGEFWAQHSLDLGRSASHESCGLAESARFLIQPISDEEQGMLELD